MSAIGDEPRDPSDPSGPEGDYSYDLVHDEVPASRPSRRAVAGSSPPDEAGPDEDGDYSYDLAHEVPPSRPR